MTGIFFMQRINDKQFPEIDTPSLLIEKSILENNLNDLQMLANQYKVKIRPHVKTHKMPYLAKLQIEAGAVGIACAKVSEAHVFADSGIKDIQIANIIIGERKWENLYKLISNVEKVSCCVDSIDNAKPLADFMADKNKIIDVLIFIDCGYGREGISEYSKILELTNYIQNNKSLNLLGITTHAGQAYGSNSNEKRLEIAKHEGEFMVGTAEQLRRDGIEIKNVVIGSNPTVRESCKIKGVTEIRTGNYIFNDMIQVALGTVGIENCALTILSQVISIPSADRVILDAGSKTLSSDRGAHGNNNVTGYGFIIGKNAVIKKLSEEHAIVKHSGENFSIGERIRIIPNHACTAVNMHDKAYLVDGDRIIEEIEIAARGKIW